MPDSLPSNVRVFLFALVVLCAAYAAARMGFDLTLGDSEAITAESLAPEDDANEFFALRPDDSAGAFLGGAAMLAGLLAVGRPDPRVFLTALAALTGAQLLLRLGFAALFGDSSVISPELFDSAKSALRVDSVPAAVAAFALLVLGMFGFAVLQTTVGFSVGPVSLPLYVVALSAIGFFVGATVARRASNPSRTQISLAAAAASALPIAYAGFRFDTSAVPLIAGSALVPIAWLAARLGASRARSDGAARNGAHVA